MSAPEVARIVGYLEHLESEEYWLPLLDEHGVADIEGVVVPLLRDGTADDVSRTCLFLRDLLIVVPGRWSIDTAGFKTPCIVESLEWLVGSPALLNRENAVYTLGKIGATESIEHLRRARGATQEADPIMLPRLAFELQWLSREDELDWYVEHSLGSACFLTRWSALDVLEAAHFSPEDPQWAVKCDALVAMAGDPRPLVCRTAAFLHEQMQFEAALPGTPKPEKRRKRKELEARRPLSFEGLAIRFRNQIHVARRDDYSAGELEAYAQSGGGQ
jgi:hypothetical protein